MSHLNPQQIEAIKHIEGPLLVLAGAGSGKTTVVINRISQLLEAGIPASDIVGVTFTNKAAEEMRSRIQKMANVHVWISTFHALCSLILRQSIGHLGYKTSFTIYDESDSESVVRGILQNHEIKIEKSTIKSIRHFISQAKNGLLDPGQISSSDKIQKLFLHDIYEMYQQKLKEYNALDFDDLLFLTVKLFRKFPEVLAQYQQKWPFLLIDEYQDTSHAQYTIAKMIVAKSNNIFAVGDPDQSIYSWRGADIGNILRFHEDFPGARVVQLEQNYRSPNTILNAANSLISNNKRKFEKKLWSEKGDGEKIILKQFDNDIEEAKYIGLKIKQLLSSGATRAKEIAIFYRTNSQSRSFEDILIKENIPYQIIGGISFYDRREVKDLIAFLRFIAAEDDFVSFSRIINIPKRGIGAVTVKRIQELIEERCCSLKGALDAIAFSGVTMKGFSAGVREEIRGFLMMIKKAEEMLQKGQIFDALKFVLQTTKYDEILKSDPETYEDRKENVNELLIKISEFCLLHPGAGLSEFIEEITLNTSQSVAPDEEHIFLMTFHNSKGLEFDTVFMVGMEEDLFPHINARESDAQIEEERRLCYVGVTRAKKQLFMTSARYRVIWGMPKYTSLSRFVKEIDPIYIQKEEQGEERPSGSDIQVESMVYHPSFGKGLIKKRYQTSLGLTFDIYFYDLSSIKSIVAKYAKLQQI